MLVLNADNSSNQQPTPVTFIIHPISLIIFISMLFCLSQSSIPVGLNMMYLFPFPGVLLLESYRVCHISKKIISKAIFSLCYANCRVITSYVQLPDNFNHQRCHKQVFNTIPFMQSGIEKHNQRTIRIVLPNSSWPWS